MSTGWLIFIAVVLIIIVLFQVTRTLDLVSQLKGGQDERDEKNSQANAIALFIFMVVGVLAFLWSFHHYKDTNLPEAASAHGGLIEDMFLWTLYLTGFVFIICNIVLFTFALKYRYKRNRQATHFSHSNKLEFIWTIIPTIVLTGLVIFGLQAWTKIMGKPSEDALIIEVTGQQFFWTSRYPGEDGELGLRDYNLICPDNPLGIVTREYVEHREHLLFDTVMVGNRIDTVGEIQGFIVRKRKLPSIIDSLNHLISLRPNLYRKDDLQKELKALEDELEDADDHIKTRTLTLKRIQEKYTEDYFSEHSDEMTWGYDDILPSEIHLPVNKEVMVKITALDVLHDFYVPHMKVKMDAVPGMPTTFKFTPIITTIAMREILKENPYWREVKEGAKEPRYATFNYEVACAELCGSGHSAMKYIMVIDDEASYKQWLASLTPAWDGVVANLKIDKVSEFAPKSSLPAPASSPAPTDSAAAQVDSTSMAIK